MGEITEKGHTLLTPWLTWQAAVILQAAGNPTIDVSRREHISNMAY